MLSANVPVEEIAEQYLRAVMQCAADVVEPARLQAVTGWQNELRKRRQLQDQLQELKGSIPCAACAHSRRGRAAPP